MRNRTLSLDAPMRSTPPLAHALPDADPLAHALPDADPLANTLFQTFKERLARR